MRKNSVPVQPRSTEFDLLRYLDVASPVWILPPRSRFLAQLCGAWSTVVNLIICEPTSANYGRSLKMIPENPEVPTHGHLLWLSIYRAILSSTTGMNSPEQAADPEPTAHGRQ